MIVTVGMIRVLAYVEVNKKLQKSNFLNTFTFSPLWLPGEQIILKKLHLSKAICYLSLERSQM